MRRRLEMVRGREFVWRFACCIGVFMLAATMAVRAANVDVVVDGALPVPHNGGLKDAVDFVNTTAASKTQYNTEIVINLTGDEIVDQADPLIPSTDPLFFIHGNSEYPTSPGIDPTDLSGTPGLGGFQSLTISGKYTDADGNTQSRTIGLSEDSVERRRILEIINVEGTIALENLVITGGHLEDDSLGTYLGGGGLFLGAASGDTKYGTPGKNAQTITLNVVTVSGNKVNLVVQAGDSRAGIGGGAFIDATNYHASDPTQDMPGGDVDLTDVAFTDNHVVVDSSAQESGSSSFGGGLRVKNANEFTYTGGAVSGNSVETIKGSHAAGGGIVIDDYTRKATLEDLVVEKNKATATDLGDPLGGITKAMGGGLYAYHDGVTDQGYLELTITGATFRQNEAIATVSKDEDGVPLAGTDGSRINAYGGGAYFNAHTRALLENVLFSGNKATSDGGAAYGGGLFSEAGVDITGLYDVDEDGEPVVYQSQFSNNTAQGETIAQGGGLYAGGPITANDTVFSGNKAIAGSEDATGAALAQGGGIYGGGAITITATDSVISFTTNTVTATGVTSLAQGGAIYGTNTITIGDDETVIQLIGNAATASTVRGEDGGDDGEAMGGAIYGMSSIDIAGASLFRQNTVTGEKLAQGGGIYGAGAITLDATDSLDPDVDENSNTFYRNAVKTESTDGDIGIAQGGGVFGENTVDAVGRTYLQENTATGEKLAAGGGIYGKDAITIDASAVEELEEENYSVIVYLNTATAESKTGDIGQARGGGIYGEKEVSILGKSLFQENIATGEITAQGGALFGKEQVTVDATDTVSAFYANDAIAETETDGLGEAQGGAIYGAEDIVLLGEFEFGGNTATGNALAQGGAVYAGGDAAIGSAQFLYNEVTAGDGGIAQGGAIYAEGEVRIGGTEGGSLNNNRATAGDGGTAQGGAIYSKGNVTLTDTDVVDNEVESKDGIAQGGGIYLNADDNSVALTIEASEGKSVEISGNKANGTSDGIYVSGTDNNAVLNIAAAKVGDKVGEVNLLDPVTVDLSGSGTFTLNRTGDGIFNWGGANTIIANTTTFNFTSGTTYLNADYTAKVTGDLQIDISGAFGFDGARDSTIALFSYDKDATGSNSFTLNGSTEFSINLSSKLTDGVYTYVVAENYKDTYGLGGFDGQEFVGPSAEEGYRFYYEDGKIMVEATYKTLYRDIMDAADPNTKSAIDTGALSKKFETLTDEQRELLTSSSYHFNNSTPGWIMNSTLTGKETLMAGVDAALSFGTNNNGVGSGYMGASIATDQGLASLDNYGSHCGPRFWAGYIGDFGRMDSHGGFYGYKSDRHGFVAGVNYDAGAQGTIGFYAGYSHTTTKAKGVDAKVKSDTGHVGVFGRVAPVPNLPQFNVLADAGYTFSSNDSERGSGILKTTGEFDQKYYTVGLEAGYAARFGSAFFNPFVSGRYVHVTQDKLEERGALSGGMDEINKDAFTSRAGMSLGFDIETNRGTVTPSVSGAWRHEFGNTQYTSNAYFQGAGAPVYYQVKSAKMDRDSVDIGAAMRAQLRSDGERMLNVNLGYNLNKSKNRDNHSVYVGFDLDF